MGKYRLQSRNKNSMITLMEVDTECRAWYIKADDRNAAVRALKAMGKELTPVESIYVNGEDVSDEVFAAIALDMGALPYKEPEEPVPSGDMGTEDIPLPDEEPMENFALPPDDMPLPSLDDILRSGAAAAGGGKRTGNGYARHSPGPYQRAAEERLRFLSQRRRKEGRRGERHLPWPEAYYR